MRIENDYIVLQNTLQNATSIKRDSMFSCKNDILGACIKSYSVHSERLYSTNDVAFLKELMSEYSWFETQQFEEQVRGRQQQWLGSQIKLSPDLPHILYDLVSCLGEIRQFGIEVLESDRLDFILYNDRKAAINPQRWSYADISIVANIPDSQLWIKRQIGFRPGENVEAKLLSEIKRIVEDYLQYIRLGTIDINDRCDLILPCGQGGVLIHEAVGHPLEADYYFEPGNVFFNRMHTKIAGDNITVFDGCYGEDIISSGVADDGSSVNVSTALIKNGELVGLLSDAATSRYWGIPNTGHGRSESYVHPCLPRMRNTYIANGADSPMEIIRHTRKGVYALDIGGGQVDMVSGDFIFNVNSGVYVENGIPVKMVSPFLYRGNILKTLKQIDKVGNDLSFCFAMCGKKGQMIPVSYGSPTIRIKDQILGGCPG